MGESQESKKLTRALILNALVLPGSGHVYLSETLKGLVIASATMVFLLASIVRFVTAFSAGLRSQPMPGMSGSLSVLAAMGQAWKMHGAFILVCLLAVVLFWAYGIADVAVMIKRGKVTQENQGGRS